MLVIFIYTVQSLLHLVRQMTRALIQTILLLKLINYRGQLQ